jgi:hypothetical protein
MYELPVRFFVASEIVKNARFIVAFMNHLVWKYGANHESVGHYGCPVVDLYPRLKNFVLENAFRLLQGIGASTKNLTVNAKFAYMEVQPVYTEGVYIPFEKRAVRRHRFAIDRYVAVPDALKLPAEKFEYSLFLIDIAGIRL